MSWSSWTSSVLSFVSSASEVLESSGGMGTGDTSDEWDLTGSMSVETKEGSAVPLF